MKRTLLSFAAVVLLSTPAGSATIAGAAVTEVVEHGAILVSDIEADGEDGTACEGFS